ncbi:MAG TPA: hypothetical protein PLB89_02755 [Flavobacteriales bacterium]|nr:hypothetical protein [Flavobacteriales bacterium]
MQALLVPALVQGQQPIEFDTVRLNPLNSFLVGLSVFETSDGYRVWGMAGDGSGDVQELHVLSFDGDGHYLSEFASHNDLPTWPGSYAPVTRSVEGGFACGLSVLNTAESMTALHLYRFNEQGDTLWTRYLVSDTTVAVRKCMQSSNGDYLLVGLHERPTNAFLCRVLASGELLNFMVFDEVPAFFAMSVAEDANQDLYVCGYGRSVEQNNNNNANLIKCGPDGSVIWRRTKPLASSYNQVVITADGGVAALGYRSPNGQEPNKAIVVKYTADGAESWSRDIVASDGPLRVCGLADGFELVDGSLVVCGSIRNTTTPGLWDNGMLHKLDADGNVLWSRYYAHYTGLPVGYDHVFNAVQPTSDGGFILTGEAQGPTPPNTSRLWLVKLDSMGCLVPGCHTVGVQEFESALQSALQVSPNPATEAVRFNLELPSGYQLMGAVQALLLDAQGKEIARERVQANGSLVSGALTLEGQAQGLYYLHLRDEVKWLAGQKVVVE